MSALCLGHQDFVTLIACISIQHLPGAQCKRKSNLIERCSSMQRGEGKEGVSKHAAGVDGGQRTKKSSHSAPLK